ncbi:RNA-guided endonuclease TnpB family protein [Alicyclobacillus suci]|uniref:RNA-guided endonuclease TnpB family protein n=1 Tax=Alicyclobacillus suci TaxID=2816080 RepID=UPI001A8F4E97|nr:RNA-guided endonuclease TnpB family protein [Alicyclobacillus suci]
MQQTITLKLELLKPTKAKQQVYLEMTSRNTAFANWLLQHPEFENATSKVYFLFSEHRLPAVIVNQTIRYVASKHRHQQARQFRKLWCEFNNQSLRIEKVGNLYTASFPTLDKRIGVPLVVKDYQLKWLEQLLAGILKQGSAKLVYQHGRWYLLLSVTKEIEIPALSKRVMGIDVGLRFLAVAAVGTKTFFFKGNQAAFIRRRYASLRRRLGKAKKLDAIRKLGHKEQRWIRDFNHKISRQIVNHAIANGVGIIRMENLTSIRKTADHRHKKQRTYLHKWAFYQLQQMIEYKAHLVGIRVEYVNARYTSQTCRHGHKAIGSRQGIDFCCKVCGDKRHADANAAMNIAKDISGIATKRSGKRSATNRTTSKRVA